MTDKKKVINGLQCIIYGTVRCESCGYAIDKHGHHSCQQNCALDAIALLKEQEVRYTPEEAWRVLVSHGQQDKRFGWGEVIKYSPSEVQEILEEAINDLWRNR